MFYLCSASANLLHRSFVDTTTGLPTNKYPDTKVVLVGQTPDCTSNLFLTNTIIPGFTQHNSVPEGYDFIFRQEWGLSIDEAIIHRVIETLRKEEYPPMEDYLDAVVKNDQEQLQRYIDSCLAVKQKYPKFTW